MFKFNVTPSFLKYVRKHRGELRDHVEAAEFRPFERVQEPVASAGSDQYNHVLFQVNIYQFAPA